MRQKNAAAWFLCVAAVLLIARPSAAQTVSTGTIAGTVKDSTGGVLPGVIVEVSSPALIEKVRSVVSDGQGQYKIVDLRPARYSVTFTLSGFNTTRQEAIDLSAGFTATINATLQPATVEQTVVVTAANPVIDIQNVSTQSVLTRERLNALPATQSILGISQVTLGMTPSASGSTGLAADVGGNKGEQIASMAVHGGNQADQISMVDGLSMQHTLFTGSGFFRLFFFNQMMAQEINVVSRGGSGEVQTAGVQVNMISKSGSNSWRYEGQISGTNKHFNATNLDDYLIGRGVATPPSIDKIYDFGIGVGGPIKRDKLWVYGSTRAWGASEIITANYYNATQGTFTYTPDPSHPADRPSPNRDVSANFTFQATRKDRVTLFPMYQQNCNCRRGVNNSPATAPEGSEMGYFKPLFNLASTWSRAQSDRLLFQAGFMYVDTTAHYAPAPEVQAGDVPVTEASTGQLYTSRVDTGLNHFHDPQGNGYINASYVTGSHALKAGFAFLRGYLDQYADFTSAIPIAYTVRKATATSPPSPVSITEYALPTHQHDDITTMGIFLQDQWTMRRMTLNLGIRYDSLHAWVPAQTRPADIHAGILLRQGRQRAQLERHQPARRGRLRCVRQRQDGRQGVIRPLHRSRIAEHRGGEQSRERHRDEHDAHVVRPDVQPGDPDVGLHATVRPDQPGGQRQRGRQLRPAVIEQLRHARDRDDLCPRRADRLERAAGDLAGIRVDQPAAPTRAGRDGRLLPDVV